MTQKNYVAHHAEVTVKAPVHQVYTLFSHFNDFPKFMHFVKEVTYYDDKRSHWVADVVGHHEWDAENENWVPDRQIGWHSISAPDSSGKSGLDNFGKITFEEVGTNQTKVDVYINYDPPGGLLGDIGERMGAGSRFEHALQDDLDNFARMVEKSPPGALDPESSNYLFHDQSAAARGETTERQNATMSEDLGPGATTRPTTDRDITGTTNKRLAGSDIDTGFAPIEPREVPPPRPPGEERR